MVSEHLFYAALMFLAACVILNIYQYATVCSLQGALDKTKDDWENHLKEIDDLRRQLRASKVEIQQQQNRALRAEMVAQRPPVDHVFDAVQAGYTGMLQEAKDRVDHVRDAGRARVNEQRRLDNSKHLQKFQSREADSYSHVQAAQDAANIRALYLGNVAKGEERDWRKEHERFVPDCSPVYPSPAGVTRLHEATPIDHSPPHSTITQDHNHQDHASFSCDSGSSSSDSSPSSSDL
jgi:cell division septum initiation protein DivIVA